jgi:hypothetical protein
MHRHFAPTIAASALFMAAVLLADGAGLPRQLALGLATALFLSLLVRRTGIPPAQVLTCVLVATTGEVVLSLGWGLYEYRHALIPLYVPPGHGLFYTLAAFTASQEALRRHERAITRATLVSGSIVAALSLVVASDVWGFLWWLGALALIRCSRNQLLLSACFAYTLVLEWAGTAIGNWRWAALVPGLGLHSANPPAGVGILYILLDLIVVGIASLVASRTAVRPGLMRAG